MRHTHTHAHTRASSRSTLYGNDRLGLIDSVDCNKATIFPILMTSLPQTPMEECDRSQRRVSTLKGKYTGVRFGKIGG